MRGYQPCQLDGILWNTFLGLEILVHERQRIVGERDARYLGPLQCEFLLCSVCGAPAECARPYRAGEDKYAWNHGPRPSVKA